MATSGTQPPSARRKAYPLLDKLLEAVPTWDDVVETGRVQRVVGLTVEAMGPRAVVGDLCEIEREGREPLLAEVVGFQSDRLLLTPMGPLDGIGPGSRVVARGRPMTVPVGEALIGRVLDGTGRPIDGKGALPPMEEARVWRDPPSPM